MGPGGGGGRRAGGRSRGPALVVPPGRRRAGTTALPLGNGRLGAMVFGDVRRERIQLNESSLWMGGRRERDNPEALAQSARGAPAALRGAAARGGGAGRAQAHGPAPPAGVLPDAGRPAARLRARGRRSRTTRSSWTSTAAVARLRYQIGRRALHARGLRERARPGARRAPHRRPAPAAVALGGPGPHRRTRAPRSCRRPHRPRGQAWPAARGLAFQRLGEDRRRGRPRSSRSRSASRWRRRRGDAAAGGGHQLPRPASRRAACRAPARARPPPSRTTRLRADHVADHQRLFRRAYAPARPAAQPAKRRRCPTDERLGARQKGERGPRASTPSTSSSAAIC